MDIAREPSETRLRRRWIAASAVGLGVGLAVYLPLGAGVAADESGLTQILIAAGGGLVFGIALGVAQRFVLLRATPLAGGWIAVTAAAGVIGGIFAVVVGNTVSPSIGFRGALVVGGAILGGSVGIGQSLILRRHVKRAGWWIASSLVGLAGGLGSGTIAGALVFDSASGIIGDALARVIASAAFLGLGLGVFAVLTGWVIVELLRRPIASG